MKRLKTKNSSNIYIMGETVAGADPGGSKAPYCKVWLLSACIY